MTKLNGFTLIETLFVLALISMGSYFLLPISQQSFNAFTIVENEILIHIEKARLNAVLSQQSQTISFLNDCIYVNNRFVYRNEAIEFYDNHITYNSLGHIQQAKTIQFRINQKEYKLTFNLGQGAYYIEKN